MLDGTYDRVFMGPGTPRGLTEAATAEPELQQRLEPLNTPVLASVGRLNIPVSGPFPA